MPYLSDAGRLAYSQYLSVADEKAFAINKLGKFAWEYGTDDPLYGALDSCFNQAQTPALYIVWMKTLFG